MGVCPHDNGNGVPDSLGHQNNRMAVLSVVAIRFGYKALLIEWAIDAISKAEKEFVGTKLGEARLAVVVSWLREKVPAPIRFLVTDDLIRKAVQTSFNAAKSGLEVLKNA